MVLDHPTLSPFEPLVRELFDSAFGDALSGLATARLRLGDEWHTEAARVFRAACLPGFNKTQLAVGATVLDLERRIAALKAEEALARGGKDPSATLIKAIRLVLSNRQLVLRRLMDSMLWVLVWPNRWVLRCLRVEGGIKQIAPDTLEPLPKALEGHREKRNETFSLICDLTTTAQLGDLIIAMWIPPRNDIKIVVAELKVGSMNILLHERLHRAEVSDVEAEITTISAEMGRKVGKQAARIVRQEKRLKNFENVIATDNGIDPLSGRQFRMTKGSFASKDYRDQLAGVMARAKANGWHGLTIDRCLHLIAQVRADAPRQREALKIAHDFYHMRHGAFCAANGSDASKQRETDAIATAPKVVNLVDFGMRQALAMPPLLWYPRDLMLDALMGRIEVFAQFHYESFFDLAAECGLKMSFIRGKSAVRVKTAKLSGALFEYRDARFVRVENERGLSMIFGARFFGRTYLSLVRLRDLVVMITDLIGEAAKEGPRLATENS